MHIFKKLAVSAVVSAMLFTACDKANSSDEGSRKDMLVGTWHGTHTGYDLNGNGTVDNGELRLLVDSLEGMHLTLDTGWAGHLILHNVFIGDDTANFTWTLANNQQILQLVTPIDTLRNDTASLSILAFDPTQFTVMELNADTLARFFIFMKQ